MSHSFLSSFILSSSWMLAGCRTPLSSLDTAGPVAGSIATLWWVMLLVAAGLFVLVIVLFALAYRKPGYARNSSTRTWLLHAGVVMPVIVLTALASFAFALGERLVTRSGEDIVRVEAIASRWAWHFRNPEIDPVRNLPILHIPVGRPVEVRVMSSDVIHAFWVPKLAGKIDAIPGHETRVQLLADRPGEYAGVCAEFCGAGHTIMHFRVIAHEADAYRSIVEAAAR
jgi:cytochrome c oxidase subunit 2